MRGFSSIATLSARASESAPDCQSSRRPKKKRFRTSLRLWMRGIEANAGLEPLRAADDDELAAELVVELVDHGLTVGRHGRLEQHEAFSGAGPRPDRRARRHPQSRRIGDAAAGSSNDSRSASATEQEGRGREALVLEGHQQERVASRIAPNPTSASLETWVLGRRAQDDE